MKRLVSLLGALGIAFIVTAQHPLLNLTTEKTTSLIFPFSIVHVDRGTVDVLVEQVKATDNILLLKAGKKAFPETNLSVVTSDGSLYSFRVCYAGDPTEWVYRLPVQKRPTLSFTANSLLDNPPLIKGLRRSVGDIEAAITGIYIRDNHLFFQLRLQNRSALDYDIDFIRFFIRDRVVRKRTAIQEIELKPLFIAGNQTTLKAKQTSVIVIALGKFTIPSTQHGLLEVGEKDGTRLLQLKLPNKKLFQAITLPEEP